MKLGRASVQVNGERELKAGRDYGLWPFLKWGHAHRNHQRLLDDFRMWRASLGEESRANYSDDHRVVTFNAKVATAAPTYEWSLAFGDTVHNYRSALDALAWEMAHLDGAAPDPKDARQIYFPAMRTREAFDRVAAAQLRTVPSFVIERMRRIQPYHHAPNQQIDDGIGLVLNLLDNQDKHRSALEMRAVAADNTHYRMSYRPRVPADWPDGDDGAVSEWIAPDRPIADDDPILRWTFPEPVDDAQIGELPMQLMVEMDSRRDDAFELLALIDRQVAQTFAVVETGLLREQWSPERPG